jgi:hypothetical protein
MSNLGEEGNYKPTSALHQLFFRLYTPATTCAHRLFLTKTGNMISVNIFLGTSLRYRQLELKFAAQKGYV